MSEQATELANNIIKDITDVNDSLVKYQYMYTVDLEKINARLLQLNLDSVYIMTLLKSMHIITANITASNEIADDDKHSSYVTSSISYGMLLKDKLSHLDKEESIEAIALLSNLLTILEIPTGPTEEV